MKKLYIKQKVFSLGEKFTVKDEAANDRYFVKGSFMKIPKEFRITDTQGKEVGVITKKVVSLLPKFFVTVGSKEVVIEKKLSFLKAKYDITGENLSIQGDLWNMNFSMMQEGTEVATVNKKWVSWGDSYEVTILKEELEELIICFVVALDYVKSEENNHSNANNSN
ncbi:LURP-one-related/scramblase family protein [Enterococcus sp. LJL120]